MEIILLAIIVLQLGYAVYKDISFSKERERMQIKLMSRTPEEYVDTLREIEQPEPKKEEEEDILKDYMPVEEVSPEVLLKAEDNT